MLKNCKKIVIKVGSNTLAKNDGRINEEFIENLANQVQYFINLGKEIIIVSSGAKIAGISAINKWSRKEDINYKQALCAIGQVRLLEQYRKSFKDTHIAQILLTRDDFEVDKRLMNIRNTLFTLLDEGVIPIINENDTVCVEELKIGDNDTLGALTAKLWNADALVILSDIDGLYDKNPKEYSNAKIIEKVYDINELDIKIGDTNSFGTGGIQTKIDASKICNDVDIPMILASGSIENVLIKLLDEEILHTTFLPKGVKI